MRTVEIKIIGTLKDDLSPREVIDAVTDLLMLAEDRLTDGKPGDMRAYCDVDEVQAESEHVNN